jgi:hypothetical protein
VAEALFLLLFLMAQGQGQATRDPFASRDDLRSPDTGATLSQVRALGTGSPSPDSLHRTGPDGVRLLEVNAFPDGASTGDSILLRVRLTLPPGVTIHPPDTLPFLPGVRSLGRVEVAGPNAGARIGSEVSLGYPLLLLRPGELELPPLRVRVRGGTREEGVGRGGAPGADSGREGDRWIILPLGGLSVSSVLPGEAGSPEPASPMSPPSRESPVLDGVALGGVLLSLGFFALAPWSGRGRRPGDASGSLLHGPPALTPEEARKRLRRLLETASGSPREVAGQFEEASGLFRTVLGGWLPGAPGSHTSAELLVALPPERRANPALLAEILWAGDRQRFGGRPLPAQEAREALAALRRWVEDSDV